MTLVSRGLVVFQIVVTCVLLIGSLLQVRSILNQQTIDYGYDTDGILSARMGLMDGDYPTAGRAQAVLRSPAPRSCAPTRSSTRSASPAASGWCSPATARSRSTARVYKDKKDRPLANFEQVTGSYFGVTSQKLLEGRNFNEDDLDSKLPVAIVNAAFARKHFGNESPIGRRFRTMNNAGTQPGPWRTIVGVVSTVRMLGPFNNPGVDDSGFYVPFYSTAFGPAPPAPFVSQFATVVVRPRGGPAAGRGDQRAAPRGDQGGSEPAAVFRRHAETPASRSSSPQNRIIATMFTIFGAVAVVLASVGIYGVSRSR